jgi:hypothetical protein
MAAAGPGHRRLRAKWWPAAGSALALLLVSAGCSAQAHSPPAAGHRSPPARSSLGAAPGGQPVSLGTLVAATAGTGPGVVHVRLPAGKPLMTIRFACVGAGPVALSDQHGGPIMSTGGCSPHAIYGTQFRLSPSDRQIRLTVGPAVQWWLRVWVA